MTRPPRLSKLPWCSEFRFRVIYFSSLTPLREQSAVRGPACGRGIRCCRSASYSRRDVGRRQIVRQPRLPEVPALVFCIGQDMRFHWYPSLSRTGGVERQRSWLDLVRGTISDLYNLAISVPLNPASGEFPIELGHPLHCYIDDIGEAKYE
jgi:hypothetical protein